MPCRRFNWRARGAYRRRRKRPTTTTPEPVDEEDPLTMEDVLFNEAIDLDTGVEVRDTFCLKKNDV